MGEGKEVSDLTKKIAETATSVATKLKLSIEKGMFIPIVVGALYASQQKLGRKLTDRTLDLLFLRREFLRCIHFNTRHMLIGNQGIGAIRKTVASQIIMKYSDPSWSCLDPLSWTFDANPSDQDMMIDCMVEGMNLQEDGLRMFGTTLEKICNQQNSQERSDP